MSSVVYLYGFVPPDTPQPAPLDGIAGAAVELVDIGTVRAAVSQLDEAAFAPALVEQRLTDLAWVGEQGLAHERVVAWFVDHADILPARMFTLHSSIAALRTAVAPDAARLAERLRLFRGRREWNLKVAYDAAQLAQHGGEVSTELQAIDAEIEQAAAGRRYLLERKRADIAKRELRRAAKRLADELLAALGTHAIGQRVLPLPQDPSNGAVVLTAALLVERGQEEALQLDAAARSERLAALGLLINFSGPWAPYRFVEQDVDA